MKLLLIDWRKTCGGPTASLALGAPTPSALKAKLTARLSPIEMTAVAIAIAVAVAVIPSAPSASGARYGAAIAIATAATMPTIAATVLPIYSPHLMRHAQAALPIGCMRSMHSTSSPRTMPRAPSTMAMSSAPRMAEVDRRPEDRAYRVL
jgi:hypothetical protein